MLADKDRKSEVVIPAQAGTQSSCVSTVWAPAFAGVTGRGNP